ncbi:3'-5' exonuclease family protein [Vreelandella populi]|uniref:3'-5' exonuclease family protein n=1 Tax=Vreelandella populi TaxID=2498858 RepID=UPI000F8D1C93|nr:3'-5' exonuclease family protein [Halomonas populi]RUR51650.1 DNA polymerase III subunit epsilon [Halomonas populi]
MTAPLIFIDLETTGTRATRDRITEIAALKIIDGQPVDAWSSLINPGIRVPANISQLTGIDDVMLADAPYFEDIAESLREWLGDGHTLVAHNARFDYSFLRNAFKREGHDYRAPIICTLRLSRRLAPQEPQHNLKALLARHAIERTRTHRAEDDVKALWALWKTWQARYSDEVWSSALAEELRHRTLPAHLDSRQLKDLPESPGVYFFYGYNRLPLYVGKSINLRRRVLSHFQRDYQDNKAMRLAQQIHHIEWEETAGDLGAQLREAQLVKTLMPIMNRQLRKQRKLTTWHWPSHADQPALISGDVLTKPYDGALYGLFRSAKDAKDALRTIAEEHKLCPQVLGLTKGKGRCFASQLGKCLGACQGKETLPAHTQRTQEALAQLQIKAWPWPGRIIIQEGPTASGKRAWHVVDHWCYLGSAETLKKAQRFTQASLPAFDVDSYRILNRFLRTPEQHGLSVKALER